MTACPADRPLTTPSASTVTTSGRVEDHVGWDKGVCPERRCATATHGPLCPISSDVGQELRARLLPLRQQNHHQVPWVLRGCFRRMPPRQGLSRRQRAASFVPQGSSLLRLRHRTRLLNQDSRARFRLQPRRAHDRRTVRCRHGLAGISNVHGCARLPFMRDVTHDQRTIKRD
jgi:hypothetical protein